MKTSFRLRLFLWSAVTATNVVVIALTANSLRESWLAQIQRAENLNQNVANAIEQSLSGTFGRADLVLQTLIDALEQSPNSTRSQQQAMLNLLVQRTPETQSIAITDETGRVLMRSFSATDEDTSYANQDYFRIHQAQDLAGLQITKPVWDDAAQRYILHLVRRLNNQQGSFGGIVQLSIEVQRIAQLLSRYDLGSEGTVLIRDLDFGLITRMPELPHVDAGKVGNRSVSKELRRIIESGALSGTYRTPASSDGQARFVAFVRMQSAPMFVLAAMSEREVFADWRNAAIKSLSIALGFVLMSLVAGAMLHRALSRAATASVRNRVFLQRASDGVQILNQAGALHEVNDRFCAMLGYERAQILTLTPDEQAKHWLCGRFAGEALQRLFAIEGTQTFDTQLRRRDGSIFDAEANVGAFEVAGERFLYASVRDITERKAASERIEQLAFFDALTGLPNRRLMLDRLGKALANSLRHGWVGAVMMIDMDHFKVLNDTHGHGVGDQFLIEVGARIRSCLRDSDTAARLGGDEFVVILEGLADTRAASTAAESVAEKILSALRRPYELRCVEADGTLRMHTHHCSCSLGITLFGDATATVDELMKRADTAMYQAKTAGRNTAHHFDPQMQARVSARVAMEADLRCAVAKSELLLYYQPQVDSCGEWTGAEALIRWQHPVSGMVSPAEFIPLAEESGLITLIGQWVLETACEQLAVWHAQGEGKEHLSIAVNVSARQFHQADFVAQVLDTLKRTGAPPDKLKLELTESLLVHDIEDVITRMQTLKTHGLGFSLDDFGTGYSSLTYLKRLPLNQLKIDQAFVRDILSDPSDAAIARTIVAMAQSLGLNVIAEGVETADQREALEGMGCYAYQGYFFAKPLPLAQFEQKLALLWEPVAM